MPESLRLLVIADFLEEGWPSMDLCADMLLESARRVPGAEAVRLRPKMWAPAQRLVVTRKARNLDRAAGRYLQYPLETLARARGHSAYHIVDHSYAHLALCLPRGRVGVYCHDIDAFRAALDPERPPTWRTLLARGLRLGLERASVVFYSTDAVRRDLERHGIAARARLVKAPIGVAPEFFEADPVTRDRELVLHVGSLIPRKNPAFLLELLRELRKRRPGVRLLQIGGEWAPAERDMIERAGLAPAIEQKRGISRRELARWYRTAGVVVQPSLSEGFGIPVAEALACGAQVVASDLENLREVGGGVVTYCPVSESTSWLSAVERALEDGERGREARVERGRAFSWERHAETVIGAYRELSGD